MESLVEKGLTKGIGVSNFNLQIIADMLTYCKIKPACNQIQLYPCHAQADLIKFLQDENIVPIAYSPIGKLDWDTLKTNLVDHDLIKQLAEKYQKTPVQILLCWGLSRGYAVIPKSSNEERQKENFASQDFRLSQEDVDLVKSTFDKGILLFDDNGFKQNVFV